MADLFVDRVAKLAEQTVARLRELQTELYEIGLTEKAMDLEKLILEHENVSSDCAETTGVHGKPAKDSDAPNPRTARAEEDPDFF